LLNSVIVLKLDKQPYFSLGETFALIIVEMLPAPIGIWVGKWVVNEAAIKVLLEESSIELG
jgi:hypothetical protein